MTLAKVDSKGIYEVPDEMVLRMIGDVRKRLDQITTIPLAKRLISRAEAVSALASKLKASQDVQDAAQRLRIQSERQLGELTRALPLGKRGLAAHAFPEQKTKRAVLLENGLNPARVSVAERFAGMTPEALDAAIDATPKPSLTKVAENLGFVHKKDRDRKRERVAVTAIELLEQLYRENRPPTREEIDGVKKTLWTKYGK